MRSVCRRLVRDEVNHITFHREFLAARVGAAGPLWRFLWEAQFRALLCAVRWVLWWDHRRCLGLFGTRRRAFFAATGTTLDWFLAGVRGRTGRAAREAPEALAARPPEK